MEMDPEKVNDLMHGVFSTKSRIKKAEESLRTVLEELEAAESEIINYRMKILEAMIDKEAKAVN